VVCEGLTVAVAVAVNDHDAVNVNVFSRSPIGVILLP
jgi:hypothetical protein